MFRIISIFCFLLEYHLNKLLRSLDLLTLYPLYLEKYLSQLIWKIPLYVLIVNNSVHFSSTGIY